MKVYLCGPIKDCNDAECMDWRAMAKAVLPDTLDPMRRDYRYTTGDSHIKQLVEDDKQDIHDCHVVLAYCPKTSVGTSMEILLAWQIGRPVIVVVPPEAGEPSPWLKYHATCLFDNLDSAIRLIKQMENGARIAANRSFPEPTLGSALGVPYKTPQWDDVVAAVLDTRDGVLQDGIAGNSNLVSYDGDDIVGVAKVDSPKRLKAIALAVNWVRNKIKAETVLKVKPNVVDVVPRSCQCHPETCGCPDFYLEFNGEALTGGSLQGMYRLANILISSGAAVKAKD